MGGLFGIPGAARGAPESPAAEPETENSMEPMAERLREQGFTICKKFVLKKPYIYVDYVHKKWAAAADETAEPRIFSFSDILHCEIWENSVKRCHSLKVSIVVNDAQMPLMNINLINFATPKESITYKKRIDYAQEIVSTFIYMKSQQSLPDAEKIPAEIRQLAELERQGVLTQEEFSKKKAELLEKM